MKKNELEKQKKPGIKIILNEGQVKRLIKNIDKEKIKKKTI